MAKADKKIVLKPCKVDFNGVDPSKGLPERLKVFNWGRNETIKGPVIIDQDTVAVFEANQKALGRETCAIDFNHGTVEGTPAWEASRGNPDIAGYFRPRIVEGEGLFLENVSTTPTGLAKAADFKDLSPTPLVDEKTGRLIGLHSVALTPTGAVDGLTIESAALKAMSATFKTLSVSILDQKSKPTPRAYANGQDLPPGLQEYIMSSDANMGELRTALGLPEDAGWDKIFPAVMAKIGGGKPGPIVPENLSPQWATMMTEAVKEGLKPLSSELETLKGQLATNKAQAEQAAKDQIIAQATKDGKAITLSADIIKGMSLETLSAVVATIPAKQIPMRATTMVLNAEPPKEKRTMRDSSAAINAQIQSTYGNSVSVKTGLN